MEGKVRTQGDALRLKCLLQTSLRASKDKIKSIRLSPSSSCFSDSKGHWDAGCQEIWACERAMKSGLLNSIASICVKIAKKEIIIESLAFLIGRYLFWFAVYWIKTIKYPFHKKTDKKQNKHYCKRSRTDDKIDCSGIFGVNFFLLIGGKGDDLLNHSLTLPLTTPN